jgi:hypothetical protein
MKDKWWNPKQWIDIILYKLEHRKLSKSEEAYLDALAKHDADSYGPVEDEEENDDKTKLYNFISERVKKIPEIKFVLALTGGERKLGTEIDIWSVIDKNNYEIREKIYNIEWNTFPLFQDFLINFHIICKEKERNIDDFKPSNSEIIYKREENE